MQSVLVLEPPQFDGVRRVSRTLILAGGETRKGSARRERGIIRLIRERGDYPPQGYQVQQGQEKEK
eukprot:5163004-Heterocapsa_arctica.AAC.1